MILLLALQGRRDRVVLTVWVLGLALLLLVTVQAAASTYGTVQEGRQVLGLALVTPVLLAFRGVPDGDSFGSAVHFQSYSWLAVAVALMNTFLAVRHGRGDEAAGRRELLDATPVGRLAAPLASLLLALAANAAFVVLAVAAFRAGGLPLGGAALSAGGLGLTGFGFFGVGLITGELLPTSRGANGAALVVALLAYVLRAAGDALGRPDLARLRLVPDPIGAFSPIGWGESMLPFTRPTLWPVAALTGFAIFTITIGLVLHARREAGASAVRERSGRATATAHLRSALPLAWRLQRSALLGWTAGAGLLAAAVPSLAAAVADQRFDDAAVQRIAQTLGHSRAGVASALTAGVLVLIGVLAAAAGTQCMLRPREEAVAGRAESLLAGPVSRVRWLGSWIMMSVATVGAVLLGSAAAIALASFAQGQPDLVRDRMLQTLVQAPSALAVTAITAMLVALAPRIAVAGSWLVFAVAVVIGLFGGLLQVPDRIVRLTPVGSVPALPTDDWGPTLFVGASAVIMAAVALVVVSRRTVSE